MNVENTLAIDDMHVLKENLGVFGGQGNCALASVAIITKTPINHVTNVCKKLGNKRGNWKGSVSMNLLLELMKHFNIKHESRSWFFRNNTLKKWAMCEADPNKKYLVVTTGHAQVVQSGIVADQNNTSVISDYNGRNKKLVHIFEIV